MNGILAICPTRERPKAAMEVLESFQEKTSKNSRIMFALDNDNYDDYPDEIVMNSAIFPRTGIARKFNLLTMRFLNKWEGFMFVGDDLRFETPGWDEMMLTAIRDHNGFAVAYGDDRQYRFSRATHPVLGRNLVRAMGCAVTPGIVHYLDFPWNWIGKQLGLLVWVPEVITPHLRWDALHTEPDALWTETNQKYGPLDTETWNKWVAENGRKLLAQVKLEMELCHGHAPDQVQDQ